MRIEANSRILEAATPNWFLGPNGKLQSLKKDTSPGSSPGMMDAVFKVTDDHIEFDDIIRLKKDIKKIYPKANYFSLQCKGKIWTVGFNTK